MSQSALAFLSLISIAIIYLFLFWVYKDYRVDCFRQELFELRDDLFDEAASGFLDFESNSYGMLRSTMNGFIRFGHRISFSHLLLTYVLLRGRRYSSSVPFDERLRANLLALTEEQKEIVLDYYQKMHFALARHLVKGSPLLILTVVAPLIVSIAANRVLRGLIEIFKTPIDRLDSLACVEGEVV